MSTWQPFQNLRSKRSQTFGPIGKREWLFYPAYEEYDWPDDWLNDGAKGYMVGLTQGPNLFRAPGIEAVAPSLPQLLAMKLCAWRDDIDIADARRLLEEIGSGQKKC
jgi:hypothetical protein